MLVLENSFEAKKLTLDLTFRHKLVKNDSTYTLFLRKNIKFKYFFNVK